VNRKLKKLYHKYEFLSLEIDEMEQSIEDCKDKWYEDYGESVKESPVYKEVDTGEKEDELWEEVEEKQPKEKSEKLKKLYKKLSKKLHPDHGGDEDEFINIKRFYDQSNYFEMTKMADQYDIEYDVEESDISKYEQTIQRLEKKLEDLKFNTIYCFYSGSDTQKKVAAQQLEKYYQTKIF
jgi:hypothetical protein